MPWKKCEKASVPSADVLAKVRHDDFDSRPNWMYEDLDLERPAPRPATTVRLRRHSAERRRLTITPKKSRRHYVVAVFYAPRISRIFVARASIPEFLEIDRDIAVFGGRMVVALPGEHDDRRVGGSGSVAEIPDQDIAAYAGHQDIHHNEPRIETQNFVHRFLSFRGRNHVISELSQDLCSMRSVCISSSMIRIASSPL